LSKKKRASVRKEILGLAHAPTEAAVTFSWS